MFFLAQDVLEQELQRYANGVIARDTADASTPADLHFAFGSPVRSPQKPWWKFW